MDQSDIVTLIVAVLSLMAAVSSQRQSAKASKGNNDAVITASRTDMETDAYVRARALDTQTIERQERELKEVRVEVETLEHKYDELNDKYDAVIVDNRRLRARIVELEKHEQER